MSAQPNQAVSKRPAYDIRSLEEAFPSVDSGMGKVFGSRVVVQLRTAKHVSAGGIILAQETRDTEHWNTQVAKVIAIGPAAFRNRDTLELWPEGEWCQVGDFVRVPKYGGDRWEVDIPNRPGEKATFITMKDLDLIGGDIVDPLAVVAFI